MRTAMGAAMRAATCLLVGVAFTGLAAGCGKSGSSGTTAPASVNAAGCAPIAGDALVVLDDDKKLQNSDNIIAAINTKVADPALVAALDKVADALDTTKLVALNKAVDVDRKTSKSAAQDFATSANLTAGLAKGPGGPIRIGAADFSESATLGALYEIVLDSIGYDASVQQIGNRELYEPQLEKGEIQVVPEYAASMTEFLNKKAHPGSTDTVASSDVDATVKSLKGLATPVGISFGKPSKAADQNAFAVTKKLADKYSLKTLSDFAGKCSGAATILGGPPECPQRPFCKPGLEQKYGIQFGSFASLDTGGPQTKNGLKTGAVTIGLVFSSDSVLAAG
jgi:osmoprotectant transport system substrate-binding protein